jgi:GT2 family glycosyltransferase
MEDLDLCYRLKQAGWVTWYEPSVSALHIKGGSARRRSPRLVLAFHAGMWRFYRHHVAPQRSTLMTAAVALGLCTKLVLALARSAVLRRRPQLHLGKR